MSHPIHPALAHFPIACWSLATLGDLASIQVGEIAWRTAGLLHIIGVSTAIVTMITGLFELGKISAESKAIKIVSLHMTFVMVSGSFYATTLFLRLDGNNLTAPDLFEIALSIFGFLFLCGAGWFGGKLVYEYGVGTEIAKDI